LAYSLDIVRSREDTEREEIVLVFDLGGGTFDLTVFRLEQTKENLLFEVLGTGGDDRLGGLDFDDVFNDFILKKAGIDLTSLDEKIRVMAIKNLMEQACVAKEALSFEKKYNIVIPFLSGEQHLNIDISRNEFEKCIEEYVEKVKYIIEDTLFKSNVQKKEITRVIKVGGSSKIPIFHEILCDGIGDERVYGNIDPSLCVAQGAAIYAAYLDDREVLGREIDIISRNSHALGVETANGDFFPLIPKNKKLPCECTQIFTTDRDEMTDLEISVYQGAKKKAKENTLIGKVNVAGLVKRPKETLNIKITFKVNEEQHVTIVVEEPESRIRVTEALRYT
jgi:molecular chaperone DnaK (HSP70)